MKQDILNFIDIARRTIKVDFDYSTGHGTVDSLNAQAAVERFKTIPGVEDTVYSEYDAGPGEALKGSCMVTVADDESLSGVMESLKTVAEQEGAKVTCINHPFAIA